MSVFEIRQIVADMHKSLRESISRLDLKKEEDWQTLLFAASIVLDKQSEMAVALDTNNSTVCRWFNHATKPNVPTRKMTRQFILGCLEEKIINLENPAAPITRPHVSERAIASP